MILLQDILPIEELKKEGDVLLVRHYKKDLNNMIELGLIEEYQSFQKMRAFRKAKYLISFIAMPNNCAKLYGVYRIDSLKEKEQLPSYSEVLRPFCNPQDTNTDFFLQLTKDDRYKKFEGRIIIDWIVPRGWYNTYGKVKDKEVVRILPHNFVDDFPGLMNVKLTASELKNIIENPDAHSRWYESLTRLQAVYLILDKTTGNQYVGTTYGEKGLWQRWKSYVKSGFTGGNIKLEELRKNDSKFYVGFQYSILEVLPKNANQGDCRSAEKLWKEKLGSKTYGYNNN